MRQQLESIVRIIGPLCLLFWIGVPLLGGANYIEDHLWPWIVGGILLCPILVCYVVLTLLV